VFTTIAFMLRPDRGAQEDAAEQFTSMDVQKKLRFSIIQTPNHKDGGNVPVLEPVEVIRPFVHFYLT
jgi:hypothetical protein